MARTHLGRYELKEEIDRGGMAVVYLAHDPRFRRDVAIKVLPQQFTHDPTFLGRFEREAEALASLEHAAIVPVYDFGEEDGLPYLVMRLMSGGSLHTRLHAGPLPLAEISPIVERIAAALDHAHERGMVHRDVKPNNILFDAQGLAYLSDFGIVKLAEQTISFTGTATVGTAAYMSPEQVHGDKVIDARSDIYSLGIVLYEILTGQAPFQAETPTKQMMAHVLEPVPHLLEARADLPAALDPIITRVLAKDPDDRFQSAAELAAALRAASAGQPVEVEGALPPPLATATRPVAAAPAAPETTRPAAGPERQRRWPWLVALLAVALLAALLVLWNSGLREGGERPPTTAPLVNPTQDVASVPEAEGETPTPRLTRTATSPATRTPTRTRTPAPTRTVRATARLLAPTAIPQARVVLNSVNVRGGPGTNYPSIDFLFEGNTVDIVSRTGDGSWYQVALGAGVIGWVSGDVVEIVGTVNPAAIPTAETTPTLPARPPTSTPPPPPTHTPVPPLPTAAPPPDTATPVPPPTNTLPPPTTNP